MADTQHNVGSIGSYKRRIIHIEDRVVGLSEYIIAERHDELKNIFENGNLYHHHHQVCLSQLAKEYKITKTAVNTKTSNKLIHLIDFLGPYYKSKLELKSNTSEILPVNCKFFYFYIFLFCTVSQT